MILREGRAGKFCRDRLFIFSMSSTRKFIFRYTKARLFIFIRNKILKKQKKKKKKKPDTKKPKRGGGDQNVGSEGCQDQDSIFHGIFFYFCTLPGSVFACAYILLYLKELLLKGVWGSSPRIIVSNVHTKWCHFRQF